MKIFAMILLLFGVVGYSSFSQIDKFSRELPDVATRGDESPDLIQSPVITSTYLPQFNSVQAGDFLFEIHNITDRQTGYDLQSNASTQQLWLDYGNPNYLHTIFTNSQETSVWADRTCLYFGSTDAGLTWFELGAVPVNNGVDGRSGFPAIYGSLDGEAIVADHNNSNSSTFTHTKIYSDASPFEYNFTEHDPGNLGDGPVWPRLIVDQNDNVVFASSGAPDAILHMNTLDLSTGQFSGWQDVVDGDEAEKYDFSISGDGTIAFAYGGKNAEEGDVLVMESTDGGLTWSSPVKVFDAETPGADPVLGNLRGVQVNYYQDEPCVVFEVGQITATGYFPGLPSEIRFWREALNNGESIIIADSNNVPFYPDYGTSDVYFPICRPAIGTADNGYLFVAFSGTTGDYWPGVGPVDSTAYFAGFFSYSSDGGETWSDPEKFTPEEPLRDWRYPSIAERVPVAVGDEEIFTVHIVAQGDSIPGSTVNSAPPMPVGVTAQYYHFSAEVVIIPPSVGDDGTLTSFTLEQNYPNPFNPYTTIKYSIPSQSFVQLKVYDVLGNEIANLVNEEKLSGSYTVNFNASNIPSGVYFYKLQAGLFTETKKMILLR
jgi:hypothetical protein